jgi:phosphoribosylaminoimidazole carboxylase PurE protein
MPKAKVLIICGSDSDIEVMKEAEGVLRKLGAECVMTISSAHRSPGRTMKLVGAAESDGFEVVIAGAGFAAHLAGVAAAHTSLPVLGVPLDSSPMKGLDSLLSTVQMPGGVPVGTLGIGKSGAKNAGYLAARILAIKHPEIRAKVKEHIRQMAEEVESKAKSLKPSKG